MRVWERGSGGERGAAPLIDARSSTCAVEVGGGPWWDTWRTEVRSQTLEGVDVGTETHDIIEHSG